jgi:predicted anti-sigma-YlaC factor YlaD
MQPHRDHRPKPSVADAHEHISCQEVVELVTDYLEGALATEEGALFEQHLNFCEGCERYLDQMRSTVAAVGRIEETDVPPAMRERLLVAFRDRRRL